MAKQSKYTVPSISTKDHKILWGNSAARCAICRQRLTFESNATSHTVGHMCHIVGEKNSENSPRGKSNLSLADRNTYSNLILLCRNHHAEIDLDVGKYSVPVLHKLKADHEIWVSETLGSSIIEPKDLIAINLIDSLTNLLNLNSWNTFVEQAIAQKLHQKCLESLDDLSAIQLGTFWDQLDEEFAILCQSLLTTYNKLICHFLEGAELSEINHVIFVPNKSYKLSQEPKSMRKGAEIEALWAEKHFHLLCLYTYYLNEFAEMIRKKYNPYFFLTFGKFLIFDSLGTFYDGEPTFTDPKIEDIKRNLAYIEKIKLGNSI